MESRGEAFRDRSWFLVATGFVVVVCSHLLGMGTMSSGGQEAGDGVGKRPMTEKTIKDVLREHTDRLMSLQGVVGTAQSRCAGKPCIKVYVAERTPELLIQIPSVIEGYSVEVEETGEFQALTPGEAQ